ncbi:MAG: hypothetical protein LBL38_01295, partial [Lactobacillales bacterium]|nr:hypothetical protein [Lactobacillales bacterium]
MFKLRKLGIILGFIMLSLGVSVFGMSKEYAAVGGEKFEFRVSEDGQKIDEKIYCLDESEKEIPFSLNRPIKDLKANIKSTTNLELNWNSFKVNIGGYEADLVELESDWASVFNNGSPEKTGADFFIDLFNYFAFHNDFKFNFAIRFD